LNVKSRNARLRLKPKLLMFHLTIYGRLMAVQVPASRKTPVEFDSLKISLGSVKLTLVVVAVAAVVVAHGTDVVVS
jgi:hypothetical protein